MNLFSNQLRMLLVFFLFTGIVFVNGQNQKEIKLPSPQTEIGKPLMQVLKLRHSNRNFDPKSLPQQELSNILWAAFGINRPESGKRTAPSARNWQEMDVYAVLKEGIYRYDAAANSLVLVVEGDFREVTGTQPYVKDAPLNLVYVADYTRMEGSDENRLINSCIDARLIAQNVYLYCASQELATVVRGSFNKEKIIEAFKLKPEQRPVLTQTVGYAK
jgi:SagB-type dehydrogenase family enzyme